MIYYLTSVINNRKLLPILYKIKPFTALCLIYHLNRSLESIINVDCIIKD